MNPGKVVFRLSILNGGKLVKNMLRERPGFIVVDNIISALVTNALFMGNLRNKELAETWLYLYST
jgi:hypothetical protein